MTPGELGRKKLRRRRRRCQLGSGGDHAKHGHEPMSKQAPVTGVTASSIDGSGLSKPDIKACYAIPHLLDSVTLGVSCGGSARQMTPTRTEGITSRCENDVLTVPVKKWPPPPPEKKTKFKFVSLAMCSEQEVVPEPNQPTH